MGPTNGPMRYQHVMEKILSGLNDSICKVFIDDIIIWGNSEEELLKNLTTVLNRLQERNVRISLDKCVFAARKIKYLGHIVDENGHRLDDSRIQPILDMARPKTQKEVRSLLGMTNQFRDYIPNYAEVVYPLSSLTGKGGFVWDQFKQESFDKLKQSLSDLLA